MKVSIDKSKCIMCGSCVAICPEVFEMKDDGSVDVKEQYKDKDISDDAIVAKVKEAEVACPTMAIVVED